MTNNHERNIIDQIIAIADSMGCSYTLKGNKVDTKNVFTKTQLLPAIMRRADQLSSFCLGYGLGVTFEKADTATLGVVVNFDDKVPSSLRLLCVADVMIEILQNSQSQEVVSLDDLLLD